MRLIDADALMEKLCGNCQLNDCVPDATDTVYGCMFAESIDQMPTIEAEPVRHGRWIPQENCYRYEFKCSRCGHEVEFSLPEIVDPRDYICYLDDYCGGCGARMNATDTNVGGKGDEEMDLSPLDFLAAEYDRKHPHGIRFVDCMEGDDDDACKKV